MKTYILFHIFTQKSLLCEDGVTFFKSLRDCSDFLAPEKINLYEPIKFPFLSYDTNFLNQYWGSRTIFFKNSNKVEGDIFLKKGRIKHSHFSIEYEVKKKSTSISELTNLFKKHTVDFEIEFGYLHILQEEDLILGKSNNTKVADSIHVSSLVMQEYIPDLYLCNLYGGKFTEEFGMKKLLSIPAPVLEKISNNQVYFQLVKDLKNFTLEEFNQNKKAIKEHLGMDYFFQESKGRDFAYKRVFKEIIPEPSKSIFAISDGSGGMKVIEVENKKNLPSKRKE